MMKRYSLMIALASVICLTMLGTSCLKKKVYDLVIVAEVCAEFEQDERNADLTPKIETIDVGEELDKVLADNGYSRESLTEINFQALHYGVLRLDTPGEWAVTGAITVERIGGGGGPQTIVDWSAENLTALLGQKKAATLNPAGTAVVNQAIADYLAGSLDVVLQFSTQGGTIAPIPSDQDPLTFRWKVWATFNAILPETSDVLDPFGGSDAPGL